MAAHGRKLLPTKGSAEELLSVKTKVLEKKVPAPDSAPQQAEAAPPAVVPMLDRISGAHCGAAGQKMSWERVALWGVRSWSHGGSLPSSSLFVVVVSESYQAGPFQLLFTALKQRTRLRVMIRRHKGLRGTCTGFLIAFDKHMNLVRSRSRMRTQSLSLTHRCRAGYKQVMKDIDEQWTTLDDPPVVRQRHCPQLFIRGDNVCSFAALNP